MLYMQERLFTYVGSSFRLSCRKATKVERIRSKMKLFSQQHKSFTLVTGILLFAMILAGCGSGDQAA
jgi:hypothetical protein